MRMHLLLFITDNTGYWNILVLYNNSIWCRIIFITILNLNHNEKIITNIYKKKFQSAFKCLF